MTPVVLPCHSVAGRAASAPEIAHFRWETIGVAIIARDEAANLHSLLPTLAWADEVVVVVDAASADATADVARRHGAKVIERAFDRFAAQRNAALTACTTDWVLSLDADERLSPGFVGELGKVLTVSRCAGYRIRIHSRIFGRRFRFSGTQDDRPIRLFRPASAAWRGDVHEVVEVAGGVGQLRSTLEHDTLANLPVFLRKMQHYTALEAQARLAAGRRPWRGERWFAAAREFLRRLVWKHGWLDGPTGWAFCALSGLSAWVAVDRTNQLWRDTSPTSLDKDCRKSQSGRCAA